VKSLYVETDTILHRLSPRTKLVALAAISVALFFTRSYVLLAAAAAAGAFSYLLVGLPIREALRRLLPVFATIAAVAVFNFAFNSAEEAIVMLLRLTTLMLFAATVTATVTVASFIDEITALARPLERLGVVRAADIGLAAGLVIRFVPEILDRYAAIREAHAARGLKVGFLTVLAPLIILTLRDADNIAAAIDARGFRRQ